MDKDLVKEQIKKLIDKYLEVKGSGKLNSFSEEDTKKGFIEPLFEILGWNIREKNEVSTEEYIKSAGRVDYSFSINGRVKLYLEAKSLKTDLHRPEFANQAVRYAWNKGANWAILTDFESLKVFYCQDINKSLSDKLLFEIKFNQYLDRFDQLWYLSQEAFKDDSINLYAEKIGKKLQRISVDEKLYKDLNECRELLNSTLGQWNEEVDKELLDEGVQKLLDRLVFLRVAEDRGIEDNILIPLIREWENNSHDRRPLYEFLIDEFRVLDKTYNSNLFSPHAFEKWKDPSNVTEKVIKILKGKPGYYEYDFKAMPADVLGAVYENYLGHRLAESQRGVVLDKSAKKRKEQGIYYTPEFIVDYIVRNSLKPVLDKCKTINDLKKIKVLDPACGSGSFLIKALSVINEKYKEFGNKGDEYTKITILLENIYGVDLDEQAIEIARLNLLINTLETRIKLPKLDKNIKNGNSLISGTDEELKKYFGENFRDKKPFNWEEEFPEVFKQGGFDVIIGNPPYIDSEEMTKTQPQFREYCSNIYRSAKGNWDLFCIFIEKGLKLLKNSGYEGMIIPNKLVSANYAEGIRSVITENSIISIKDYSDVPVFSVSVYPVVIIIQKSPPKNNKFKVVGKNSSSEIKQEILNTYRTGWSPIYNSNSNLGFIDEIISRAEKLGDIFEVHGAATVAEAYEIKKIVKNFSNEKVFFKLINTGAIDRYVSRWGSNKIRYLNNNYDKPILEKTDLANLYPKRVVDASSAKIIIGGMNKKLECIYDSGEYLAGKSTSIILSEAFKLRWLLGILNSKLISLIYSHMFKSLSLSGGYFRIGTPQIKMLPIIKPSKEVQVRIITMVNRILIAEVKLKNIPENSNKWDEIKSEIKKLDKKIDEEVYKLYGLTPSEIAIVER